MRVYKVLMGSQGSIDSIIFLLTDHWAWFACHRHSTIQPRVLCSRCWRNIMHQIRYNLIQPVLEIQLNAISYQKGSRVPGLFRNIKSEWVQSLMYQKQRRTFRRVLWALQKYFWFDRPQYDQRPCNYFYSILNQKFIDQRLFIEVFWFKYNSAFANYFKAETNVRKQREEAWPFGDDLVHDKEVL